MKANSFSRTAIGVARQRLVHQVLDDEPKILDDPVIVKLVSTELIEKIIEQREVYRDPRALAFRSHILLRSRLAEDCLREACLAGVRQFLLLGAGFDTFPYRQPEWAGRIKIFEVDHPSTQAKKRKGLEQAGVKIPDNLTFVPVDFETMALEQELLGHGFRMEKPVFISWLGVSMYLSPEAVDQTFMFAASCAAQSRFVFTFARPRQTTGEEPQARRARPTLAEAAARIGEPWLTFFAPEELAGKLKSLGFSSVCFFDPALIREYFQQRKDGLVPPQSINMIRAIV